MDGKEWYHAVIARKYIWVKQNVSFAHVWSNIKGLFLILTAQNQLCLNMCVEQAITLRGMILESLPLTIVMVNGFLWKPGISMRALVPLIGMTEIIYHKNIYILLVDEVTVTVYKFMSFNIRSLLMKTLDRSVETLDRECNLCVVISSI